MSNGVRVLVADDQDTEITLYEHAFRRCGISGIFYVRDGKDAVDYLSGQGAYTNREEFPFPTCMLLDLKMPRMDGFEVLQWMLDHPACRVIPTIIMSNSGLPDDINKAYRLGANSFFTKPTQLREMVDIIALIHHFWCIAQKPDLGHHHRATRA